MIANNKYQLLEQIGEGVFGTVFRGVYTKRGETVAIKREARWTEMKLLKHETEILKYLTDKGCDVIPVVHWFGVDENFTYLVMTYYDCSLEEFMIQKDISRILPTIMCGCIAILQQIHKLWVVHRDIKPANFMLKGRELFLIDFGLATFYLDADGEHVSGKTGGDSIVGSPKYASYYVHEGWLSGRRDDMLSLGYMFMGLQQMNRLPWEDGGGEAAAVEAIETYPITSIFHPRNVKIMKEKSWECIREHCHDRGEVWNYLNYCYSLKLDDTPNYEYLMKIFYTSDDLK